ncbi:MAG: excinuclease ABC subunit UvrC [Rickettsiales bacterium]|jgi:excinuclease ABC subunit C|nr:excinuclease ABC subunit UvrC [Rickettsiales bacterium]
MNKKNSSCKGGKIPPLQILKNIVNQASSDPGVYRMIDISGNILYVGKARNLKNRLASYIKLEQLTRRLQQMVLSINDIEIIATKSEKEALLLEANLIKTLNPKYNIRLKDGKTFPYIYLSTKDDFPGIYKYRGNKDKKGKYFGPFANIYDVSKIIDLLKQSFLIRGCSDSDFKLRKRPCLEYHIKRCSAPCVDLLSKSDYQKQINQADRFLSGDAHKIRQELIEQMDRASSDEDYEQATLIRDRIKAINTVLERQNITDLDIKDFDVVAFVELNKQYIAEVFFYRNGISYGNKAIMLEYADNFDKNEIYEYFFKKFYNGSDIPKTILTNIQLENEQMISELLSEIRGSNVTIEYPKIGNKKQLLDIVIRNAKMALVNKLKVKYDIDKIYQDLKEIFGLIRVPSRIELYDNSHMSGTYPVGALISVNKEGFDKANYRIFNIANDMAKGDDYAMLYEVLTRRFKRLIKEDPDNQMRSWPDLILIDGGKGQATIAKQVFKELDIPDFPFFCIAKGKERNKGKERFCNDQRDYFTISEKSVLYYIQTIRDEVHRFVISKLRKKRDKASVKSDLDNIMGIGPKKRHALIQHFGGIDIIKNAPITDLAKVKGISLDIAKTIFKYFH